MSKARRTKADDKFDAMHRKYQKQARAILRSVGIRNHTLTLVDGVDQFALRDAIVLALCKAEIDGAGAIIDELQEDMGRAQIEDLLK